MQFLISSFLCLLSPFVFGANQFTNTNLTLLIDPSSSWLKKVDQSVIFNSATDKLSFGGEIDLRVYKDYIDTLKDGSSRSPITYTNISLGFRGLDLPATLNDFDPGLMGSFRFFGDTIPGDHSHSCDHSWAIGYDCSVSTFSNSTDDQLSGTFDGKKLIVDGTPSYVWFSSNYYVFHVEATVVPLPASLPLFLSAILGGLGMTRLRHNLIIGPKH